MRGQDEASLRDVGASGGGSHAQSSWQVAALWCGGWVVGTDRPAVVHVARTGQVGGIFLMPLDSCFHFL